MDHIFLNGEINILTGIRVHGRFSWLRLCTIPGGAFRLPEIRLDRGFSPRVSSAPSTGREAFASVCPILSSTYVDDGERWSSILYSSRRPRCPYARIDYVTGGFACRRYQRFAKTDTCTHPYHPRYPQDFKNSLRPALCD